ncbi:MAG: PqqD family protein [Clostridia bacterium]|nr:PqqD family protein [Clostridia bacterium]
MKVKSGFVVRAVGDEHIAVPVGDRAKEFHGMIKLNETAEFLWSFFKDEHTEEEGIKALTETYDVSDEEAKNGVSNFVKMMTEHGFME